MSDAFTFWPEDLARDLPESPLTIVKEAANELGRATKGGLEARVKLNADEFGNNEGHYNFIVESKALAFRHYLFDFNVPVFLYPVQIQWNNLDLEAANGDALREVLKNILSSEVSKRVVKALLSQAASA